MIPLLCFLAGGVVGMVIMAVMGGDICTVNDRLIVER